MARQLPRPDAALLEQIVTLPKNDNINQMEKEIRQFAGSNRMTENMFEIKSMYVEMISDYVKSPGIVNQLAPQGIEITGITAFGSFTTHCATNDSDLDLCVCARSEVNGASCMMVLEAIHTGLQNHPESRMYFEEHEITEMVFVRTARVPIIRFQIGGVPVDLSVTMDQGPPRASLAAMYVNAYCQLDKRFAVVALFLKMWLKSEMSSEDYLRDFPNSYSLTMMLIHCLQWYGVLPLLKEETFLLDHPSDWDMIHIHGHFMNPLAKQTVVDHKDLWTDSLSIVQLLKLFAFHYSNGSMMSGFQFNMLNGAVEQRPRNHSYHAIQIVDSYDVRNPGRTVRGSGCFVGAMREFLELVDRPQKNLFSEVMRIPQQQVAKNAAAQPPPKFYNAPAPQYTASRSEVTYQGSASGTT